MYAADYVVTFTTFFIVARIMATGVPQMTQLSNQ